MAASLFASAVAKRYGNRIKYEIGNEPNLADYLSSMSPKEFMAVANVMIGAIRKEVPDAYITIGGIAPWNLEAWIPYLEKADVQALTFHPYGFEIYRLNEYRRMAKKLIAISEYGNWKFFQNQTVLNAEGIKLIEAINAPFACYYGMVKQQKSEFGTYIFETPPTADQIDGMQPVLPPAK